MSTNTPYPRLLYCSHIRSNVVALTWRQNAPPKRRYSATVSSNYTARSDPVLKISEENHKHFLSRAIRVASQTRTWLLPNESLLHTPIITDITIIQFHCKWLSNAFHLHTNMFLHLLQKQTTKERAKSTKALLNAMFLYSEVSKAEQSPAGVELGCVQTYLHRLQVKNTVACSVKWHSVHNVQKPC
jgi:hypothetical protein